MTQKKISEGRLRSYAAGRRVPDSLNLIVTSYCLPLFPWILRSVCLYARFPGTLPCMHTMCAGGAGTPFERGRSKEKWAAVVS
jgi:hypothetical protein